jgi:hypothetical protein
VLFVGVYDALYKGNKSLKELCFVHNNKVVLQILIQTNVKQIANSATGNAAAVMCDDFFVVAIPHIVGMLDNKHTHSKCCIARDNGKNARGLACKHRT